MKVISFIRLLRVTSFVMALDKGYACRLLSRLRISRIGKLSCWDGLVGFFWVIKIVTVSSVILVV
jgi:hypothetical protein